MQETRRFARLLLEGGYIVESRNSVDYMDMGMIVKARRRQKVKLRSFYLWVDHGLPIFQIRVRVCLMTYCLSAIELKPANNANIE